MRILVIYHHAESFENSRATVFDHLRCLETSDHGHDLVYHNTWEVAPDWTRVDLDHLSPPPAASSQEFVAAILHYTFLGMRGLGLPFFRWSRCFDWIRDLRCVKVAIPQDEGHLAGVLDDWLVALDVSVVCSVHHREDRPLYPLTRQRADIVSCLPGYIDTRAAALQADKTTPIAERSKDLVYRARQIPYFVGRHGQLKHRIATAVGDPARAAGLVCDVSTRAEDTILGAQWLDFLASSRAVLGVEGGYSAIDWYGEVTARLERFIDARPDATFDEFAAELPDGWDGHGLLTTTPRHFEAIITRTAQVLVEGEYKGILEAGRHYIPVAPDFSNVDEVVEQLRDHRLLQEIADRAWDEIGTREEFTYGGFASTIERAIEARTQRENIAVSSDDDRTTDGSEGTADDAVALERELAAQRRHDAMVAERLVSFQYELPRVLHEAMAKSAETIYGVSRLEPMEEHLLYRSEERMQGILRSTQRRALLACAITTAVATLVAFVAGLLVGRAL